MCPVHIQHPALKRRQAWMKQCSHSPAGHGLFRSARAVSAIFSRMLRMDNLPGDSSAGARRIAGGAARSALGTSCRSGIPPAKNASDPEGRLSRPIRSRMRSSLGAMSQPRGMHSLASCRLPARVAAPTSVLRILEPGLVLVPSPACWTAPAPWAFPAVVLVRPSVRLVVLQFSLLESLVFRLEIPRLSGVSRW